MEVDSETQENNFGSVVLLFSECRLTVRDNVCFDTQALLYFDYEFQISNSKGAVVYDFSALTNDSVGLQYQITDLNGGTAKSRFRNSMSDDDLDVSFRRLVWYYG